MKNKQLPKKDIFDLIERITPLNNRYRDLIKGGASGTDILLLMWRVGDILQVFTNKFAVKPHNLYWQIYGKAEGVKTSYITRDFLSYCLRVRRYFSNEKQILNRLPNLQRYSLFREAFPLLENKKFRLSDKEEAEVLRLLNSKSDPQRIKAVLQKIKAGRIGIKNTRTQRLSEMQPITKNFVEIYNEIFNLIKKNNHEELDEIRKSVSKDMLIKLSQAVSALTQENLYVPEIVEGRDLSSQWETFISNLKYLFSSSVEVRNRFRRLFPPRKLFELADMLNAFVIEHGVVNYRKRKNMD